MISLVTGKLGAGKTLSSVVEMLLHWRKGGTVCTNVHIHWDKVKSYCARRWGVVLDDRQLVCLDLNSGKDWQHSIPFGVPGGLTVLVILDEVQLFFNARDWASTKDNHGDMISFLTQSRKAGVDVRFITQAGATIDKQFRLQCQHEYYVVPSSNIVFGFLGSMPFKFYILIKKDANNANVLGKEYRFYSTPVFDLYDSYDMLDDSMRELAAKTERRPAFKLPKLSLWRRLRLIIAEAVRPVISFFSFKR